MCLQDTVRIPLRARDGSIRAYTIVDAADADWANQWHWSLSHGYAHRGISVGGRQATLRLHRELLGLVPGDGIGVDHINRDKLDNRRSNLRIASLPENAQNKPSYARSMSKYRGVVWMARLNKWMARIQVNGKSTYLGLFADEDEAGAAARAARSRLHPYATD